MERAMRGARRLSSYLPFARCIPIVVNRDVSNDGEVVHGSDDCLGWVLNHDAIIPRLASSETNGVNTIVINRLNNPMPGWYRAVVLTGL